MIKHIIFILTIILGLTFSLNGVSQAEETAYTNKAAIQVYIDRPDRYGGNVNIIGMCSYKFNGNILYLKCDTPKGPQSWVIKASNLYITPLKGNVTFKLSDRNKKLQR